MKLSWFDIVAGVTLIIGFFRGRKRGMSMELLPLFESLVIVVAGAQLYEPIGQKIAELSDGAISLLVSYILAYALFAVVVHMVFARLKTAVGEKLVGSDIFGSMEYYFGMGAGILRFACFLMMALAVLHAKPVDLAKEAHYKKVQNDNFGSISFPTYGTIQLDIFKNSYAGQAIVGNVPHLLIKETSGDIKVAKNSKDQAIARKREAAVDEVLDKSAAPKK